MHRLNLATAVMRSSLIRRPPQMVLTSAPPRALYSVIRPPPSCNCSFASLRLPSTLPLTHSFAALTTTRRSFASTSGSNINERKYTANISGSNYSSNAEKQEQRIAELKAKLKAHDNPLHKRTAMVAAGSFAASELVIAIVAFGLLVGFVMFIIDPDDFEEMKKKVLSGMKGEWQKHISSDSATPTTTSALSNSTHPSSSTADASQTSPKK